MECDFGHNRNMVKVSEQVSHSDADIESQQHPAALVLEDDVASAKAYKRMLEALGYTVRLTHCIADARIVIRSMVPDIMLIDIGLPDGNGLDLMEELRNDTRGRFIVISGDKSQQAMIKSIRHRAVEVLHKPVDLAQLRNKLCIRRGSPSDALEDELSAKPCWIYHGDHHSLVALRTIMSYSAERSKAHALIVGEPGLDKPAIARELHRRGRRSGRFIVVDCQEVQDDAAVVRFFGEENPETGAIMHLGYLEQVVAGTLVLDYIEHLSEEIQARLLPLLDSGSFRRVNGKDGVKATLAMVGIARDKKSVDIDESALRSDFMFRLMQNTLVVPSLVQCRQDIVRIAEHLLQTAAVDLPDCYHFSDAARQYIQSQAWPHNVLELRNAIKKALASTKPGQPVELSKTAVEICDSAIEPDISAWVGSSVWEMEKQLLLSTLAHFDGDKERAARTLDVSLKTLYNRMNSF